MLSSIAVLGGTVGTGAGRFLDASLCGSLVTDGDGGWDSSRFGLLFMCWRWWRCLDVAVQLMYTFGVVVISRKSCNKQHIQLVTTPEPRVDTIVIMATTNGTIDLHQLLHKACADPRHVVGDDPAAYLALAVHCE